MMFTVTLPRGLDPAFPDRCVRCAAACPDAPTRFVQFNGLQIFVVRIPACRPCRSRILAWLIWDNFRTLAIAGAAVAFGLLVLLPVLPGWATGLIVLGLCIVGFAAVFLWNLRYPPAFNVDAGPRNVDYEFRSDDVGREFAILNGAREVGEPV
jgi:hypothetical protein